ncbi:hypothetical protein FFI87_022695 [Burkholderia sp. KBS0801]|nr:hypothetical protein FFI87_022695 [Burkholderia sp. KBS0801]
MRRHAIERTHVCRFGCADTVCVRLLPIARLYFLWSCCTIAHRLEKRKVECIRGIRTGTDWSGESARTGVRAVPCAGCLSS